MDRVKINVKKPVTTEQNLGPITTFNVVNSGTELCFAINRDISLKEGDFLTFKKNTYTTDGEKICTVCHQDLKVLSSYTESGKTIVYTPNFTNEILTLKGGFTDESNLPYIIRYKDLVRIDFNQKHNVTVIDLLKDFGSNKIKLMAYNSGETYTISELSACSKTNINPLVSYEEKHSAFNEKLDSFYIKESDFNAISGGTYEFKITEPIYFYKDNENRNVLREDCKLVVGDGFYNLNLGLEQDIDYKKLYQEEKLTDIYLESKKETVIPTPINMEKVKYIPFVVNGTDSYMTNEIEFNFHFRDRHNCLKYTSGISVTEAVKLNAAYKESVPTEVSTGSPKYIYIKREGDDAKVYYGLTYDGWVIDDNGGWNNIDSSAEYSEMKKIMNKSDLLGYLGFADEEVKGQKNTVKKSFVRLLFYDSNDPIEQNLLTYSTIFFDAGELYGKYMKLNAVVGESYYIKEEKGPQWVFYDGDNRLDSKLEIYNEFNTEKSSEGFYIYLFEDDAPTIPTKYSRWGSDTLPTECSDGEAFLLVTSGICISETKSFDSLIKFARKGDFIVARTNDKGAICWEVLPSSKDIYMKVEFNHAKYGRTLPMLMWPKNKSAEGLTLEEYFKALYIRVNLHRVGNKYVYTMPDIENDMENGKITISLFEPKLKIEDEND